MDQQFDIPENWQVVTLEDVAEGKNSIVDGPFGSNLKTSDYIDDHINGVPVLTTKNLEGDYSDKKVRFISKEKFNELKRSQVNPGDILVAKIGSIGKVGIYPKDARVAIIPANLLKFTVSSKVVFKYVFYYLTSRGLQNRIKNISTATAQPAFNVTKFRKLRIPLPPKEQQHAIVYKIEELFSEIDKGIENLRVAQQQLKVYRQSVLQWAFEGKLTKENVVDCELPKGWEWRSLGENIKNIDSGKSYRCNERPPRKDEVGIIKVSSVTWGVFDENESKTCFSNDLLNEKYLIKDEDFLFSRANTIELIGACVIVKGIDKKLMLSDKILRFTFSEEILKPYLLYFLRSKKGRKQIETLSTGNQDSMRNIGQEKIRRIEFPFCPLENQRQVVYTLESRLSVADKIEETIIKSLQQAEALKQSILKKAFEGKLIETGSSENEEKIVINPKTIPFPVIKDIKPVELHVGVVSMIIDLHEKSPAHLHKLSHVKCEKISDLIERKIGISLGRKAVKDAAGPDDFPHLKKVEHRAKLAGFYSSVPLPIGHTYKSGKSAQKAIAKVKAVLTAEELSQIEVLLRTFLPFELEHAELVATLFAGWNNLLIDGKKPTDEEIVYESRENWSKRKLTIEREKFFQTLKWMKGHGFVPEGRGTKCI